MFQWVMNNMSWLVYVAIFVIPVLSSIGKWFQQQAAKKQAEAQRKRQAEAQLRTGRSEATAREEPKAGTSDDERQETFAERRRRQIEELRTRQDAARRQREAAQQGAQRPSPAADGPTISAPKPAQPQPTPAAPSVAVVQRRRVEKPSQEVTSLAERFERNSQASRRPAARDDAAVAGLRLGAGLDRQSLRKAVVLAEVLAPPVSLRNDGQKAV